MKKYPFCFWSCRKW